MSKPVIDGIKEFFRIVLIAVIPVLIGQLQSGTVGDWKVIGTIALIAALKAIDEFLHEKSKAEPAATRNEGFLGVKGLTNF